MMAQFLEVKAKHPEFLLFYRMGDFFELFFDDAVKASSALGIQLTKRGKHSGEDIPMCGVPVARADEYLQKLIRKGFRVAVAEQLEDPEAAKKRGPKSVVRRDVVRLVTPGTLTEDALLTSSSNNFLTAVARSGKGESARYNLASLDISTGEFLLGDVPAADLEGELLRLRPAEILLSDDDLAGGGVVKKAGEIAGASLSPLASHCFSRLKGERALKQAFEVSALDGLGDFSEGELSAIGALLDYVSLTQMGERPALRAPRQESGGALLAIDAATRTSLELVRPKNDGAPTVFSAIDRTATAAGARELMSRLVSPSTDVAVINARLDAVSLFIEDWALRERVRHGLKNVPDMSRALSRLKLKRGGPRDLGALRDGLNVAAQLGALLREVPALPEGLAEISDALGAVPPELVDALNAALGEKLPFLAREGGFIAPGYDAVLDELRQLTTDTKVVLARLQAAYAERTGVKSLKIQYNQVFGYFVEVSPGAAPTLQAEPHAALFRHKQTLANAVRFTTDELSDLENRILNATSEALARETELFDRACRRHSQCRKCNWRRSRSVGGSRLHGGSSGTRA